MDKDSILAQLRAHEAELKAAGIASLSIFGSVARGDATDRSDVDVVVRLSPERSECGFAYFGQLDALTQRLQEILGCPVDIVSEPVRKERLRRAIERDAALAF
jgi:predicted nucleotidyltransferase